MGFRLVPKSVILNDPELYNGPIFALFYRNSIDSGVNYTSQWLKI